MSASLFAVGTPCAIIVFFFQGSKTNRLFALAVYSEASPAGHIWPAGRLAKHTWTPEKTDPTGHPSIFVATPRLAYVQAHLFHFSSIAIVSDVAPETHSGWVDASLSISHMHTMGIKLQLHFIAEGDSKISSPHRQKRTLLCATPGCMYDRRRRRPLSKVRSSHKSFPIPTGSRN